MTLSNSALQKIEDLAQSIIGLITTHENKTATSSQKGHVMSSNLVKDIRIDGTSNVGTDNGYYALADHEHKILNASTSAYGITKLSNSTSSTSQALAATPKAVKTAYDLANGKPDLGTTSTTAATGDHTHDYSKVSVSQTKTSGIEIGKVTIDGVSTPLYQQDNDTTYTAASATPTADTSSGAVGTSSKYAREDHTHPQSALYAEANHNHTLSNISNVIEYYRGVNILKGTRLFTGLDVCPSASTINGTYYDCNVRYMQNTSSSSNLTYEYYIPYSNIVNGEYYTLSFWAKTTTSHDVLYTYWYVSNSDATKRIESNSTVIDGNEDYSSESSSFNDGRTRFYITTEWKRYYVVYQANPNPSDTSSNRRLLIRLNKNNYSRDLYLAGVKFEKGNRPTPYCENIMDYADDIIAYMNQ